MGVGRHYQPAVDLAQKRPIIALRQVVIVEMLLKDVADQVGHGAAARTVRHVDGAPHGRSAGGESLVGRGHYSAASRLAGFWSRKRP